MTRAFSRKPAKTKVYKIGFLGPRGGSHRLPYVLKLNQQVSFQHNLTNERGSAILKKMKQDGWIVRVVEWYNSSTRTNMAGEPTAFLIYRIHKNDVYNDKLVKPGWRIAGEY